MHPVKLFAKLTPKGVSLSGIRGTNVDVSAYDVSVALALGDLSKPAYWLGRAKYCNDALSGDDLWGYLANQISQKAVDENWRLETVSLKNLALLSLRDILWSQCCDVCKGVGEITVDNKKIECQKCNGTGSSKLTDREGARIINCSKDSFRRVWRSRLDDLDACVCGLDQDVIEHLWHQFKDAA